MITGDGDGLSIGGNHLLHALRRNVNLNILLFNNEIYGLTKGQDIPHIPHRDHQPIQPRWIIDAPINPGLFALGAGASFFARAVDVDQKGLPSPADAANHQGTACVEILQNCIVYNKDVFDDVVAKKTAAETQIHVRHGEPLIFGQDHNRGLRLNPRTLALEGVALEKTVSAKLTC